MKTLRLSGASFSMAIRRSLAFRANLVFDVLLAIARLGTALATVLVVFTRTDDLLGWSRAEALVLIGTFQILSGVKGAFLDPNLSWFPDQGIRQGRLDVYLLQPAPTLYLAGFTMAAPLALIQACLGGAVVAGGLIERGHPPEPLAVLSWLALLIAGLVVTWSIGVLLACLAFWAPRLQLEVFYGAVWQLGRYPVDIYRSTLRFVLTYLLPLTLIGSAPASALVRGTTPLLVAGGVGGAALSAAIAATVWRVGLRRYTGATS